MIIRVLKPYSIYCLMNLFPIFAHFTHEKTGIFPHSPALPPHNQHLARCNGTDGRRRTEPQLISQTKYIADKKI